jgi:hypothetical protein
MHKIRIAYDVVGNMQEPLLIESSRIGVHMLAYPPTATGGRAVTVREYDDEGRLTRCHYISSVQSVHDVG